MYFKFSTTFFVCFWNHPSPPWTLPVQYGVLREASRGEAGLGSFRRLIKTFDSEDFREDVDGEPLVSFFWGGSSGRSRVDD